MLSTSYRIPSSCLCLFTDGDAADCAFKHDSSLMAHAACVYEADADHATSSVSSKNPSVLDMALHPVLLLLILPFCAG